MQLGRLQSQPELFQVQLLLALLVGTGGGGTYTFDEIAAGLTQAGFERVRLLQAGERMDALVEAFKAAP